MDKLFLTILNMSITATYVLAFVLVLRLLLKRAPKWISYALWSIVLVRLISPVSFSANMKSRLFLMAKRLRWRPVNQMEEDRD